MIFLTVFVLSCSPKVAPVIGQDGTDWNARAEEYRNNPAALKAFVEECESHAARAQRLQNELSALRNDQSAADGNYQATRNELAQVQAQLANVEQQLATARAALNNRDEVITDQQLVNGVIFRVQLGAFAQNRLNNDLDTGNALSLNEQNGLQKVVVAQFRTYSNAKTLRDQLRKMGVKDAFIVAYSDGNRIDVGEALRLTGQQ